MTQEIKGSLRAWWSSQSNMENFQTYLEADSPENSLNQLSYAQGDMGKHGWIQAGEAQIHFTPLPRAVVVNKMIDALRQQQQDVRAKSESFCRQAEERIQSLLAITHEPEPFNEP